MDVIDLPIEYTKHFILFVSMLVHIYVVALMAKMACPAQNRGPSTEKRLEALDA